MASSGSVSRDLFASIVARARGDDAHETCDEVLALFIDELGVCATTSIMPVEDYARESQTLQLFNLTPPDDCRRSDIDAHPNIGGRVL